MKPRKNRTSGHAQRNATSHTSSTPSSTTRTAAKPQIIVPYRITASSRGDLRTIRELLKGVEIIGAYQISPGRTAKLVFSDQLALVKDKLSNSKFGCFPKGYPSDRK